MLSSIPEVDVPTVHGSFVLCFESHLLAGLGLPHSKFLATIMNYLGYSLVHFNGYAIAALSSFMMLCECWLRILLLLSVPVCQIHLWRDWAISAPPPSGRVYSYTLQELLKEFTEEMVPG
jgi:hypothetical protein